VLTLAFESSAKAASAALCDGERLIALTVQCSGLTHSRTLLPMAEDLLKNTDVNMADIDCFAVAQGPGSFTGIRIGVSTVKGLAWAAEKPCIGVSTLAAMAWNGAAAGGLICAVMDARRSEVYNALFRVEDGRPKRLCEDRALSLSLLAEELKALSETEELELELVGLCTDICVISNALLLKAFLPEVRITVDASCCAGVTPQKHLAALETMRSCQIAVVNG
jgi:tRNA threonylcarbamoyladenosine biosynthesis protein TsaB